MSGFPMYLLDDDDQPITRLPGEAAAEYARTRIGGNPTGATLPLAPMSPADAAAWEPSDEDSVAIDAPDIRVPMTRPARQRAARTIARDEAAMPGRRNETTIADELSQLGTLEDGDDYSILGDAYDAASTFRDSPAWDYASRLAPQLGAVDYLAHQRYNPAAIGAGTLDALTMGNAAEVASIIDQHRDNAPGYDASLAQRERENAENYESNPGSMALGMGVGMLPLAVSGGGLGAPGAGSRLVQAARMAALPTAIGATTGAVGGALGARPGARMEGALAGGTRGLVTGAVAGGLGAAGQALRMGVAGADLAGNAIPAAEGGIGPIMSAMTRPISGALTGAGYGVAATPGAVNHAGPMDYLREAGHGAAAGAILEPATATVGSLVRGLGRNPAPPVDAAAEADAAARDIDEMSLLGFADEAPIAAPTRTGPVLSPAEIVAQERAASQRTGVGDAVAAMYEGRPEYLRMSSLMAHGPGRLEALRSGVSAFGTPRALVNELQAAGLARPNTVYSRPSERALLQSAQERVQGELSDIYSEARAAGVRVPARPAAERIRARARAAYAAGGTSDENRAAYRTAMRRADAVEWETPPPRRAQAGRRIERLEPIGDDAAIGEPIEADVEYMGTPRMYDLDTVRGEMSGEWNTARASRTAARNLGSQTPGMRLAPGMYADFRPTREEILSLSLAPETHTAMRPLQRSFQAMNAFSPVENRLDINSIAAPANMRGFAAGAMEAAGTTASGGSAGEGLVARGAGFLRENLIANYQDSILASLNESNGPSLRDRLAAMISEEGRGGLRNVGEMLRSHPANLTAAEAVGHGMAPEVTDARNRYNSGEGIVPLDAPVDPHDAELEYFRQQSGEVDPADIPPPPLAPGIDDTVDPHDAELEYFRSLDEQR